MRQIQKDSLFEGNLVCCQYEDGYRFSIDSVLLAHYPAIKKNELILDLGTGAGIVSLILCHRYQQEDISITGIEVQKDLAALARKNIELNKLEAIFSIIEGDVGSCRALVAPETYSLIISNPPFHAAGSGRLNAHPEAVTARHQGDAGLVPFVEATAFALQNRGRAVMVYPADKIVELLHCFSAKRLNPKAIQFIYSYPEADSASLVIVEAVKNGGSNTQIEKPLIIFHSPGGDYTEPVQSMLAVR